MKIEMRNDRHSPAFTGTVNQFIRPFEEAHDLAEKLFAKLESLPLGESDTADDLDRAEAAAEKAFKLLQRVEELHGRALLRVKREAK